MSGESGENVGNPERVALLGDRLQGDTVMSEEMLSETVMASYEDLVNQQAQAAAAAMILGAPARNRVRHRVLPEPSTVIKYSSGSADDMLNLVANRGAPTTTQLTNYITVPHHGVSADNMQALVVPPVTDSGGSQVADGVRVKKIKQSTNRKSCGRRSSDREEKYQCSQCPYRSRWSHGLSNHMRTHNNTRFKCDHCDYSTPWKGDLTNHVRVHTGDMFKCDQCDFQTYRKQALKHHLLRHSGTKPYQCSECSYSSSQQCNLKKHMMTHTGEKPLSCDHCSYSCRQFNQLKNHAMHHHNIVLNTDSSSQMRASNSSAAVSRRGRARVPIAKNRKFTCTLCRMSWMSKQSYSRHMLSKHGSKDLHVFKCGFVCWRSFSSAAECKKHKATHGIQSTPETCDASTCTSLDEEESPFRIVHSQSLSQLIDQSDSTVHAAAPSHPIDHRGESKTPQLLQILQPATMQSASLTQHTKPLDYSLHLLANHSATNSQSEDIAKLNDESSRTQLNKAKELVNEYIITSESNTEFFNQSHSLQNLISQSEQLIMESPSRPSISAETGDTQSLRSMSFDGQSAFSAVQSLPRVGQILPTITSLDNSGVTETPTTYS